MKKLIELLNEQKTERYIVAIGDNIVANGTKEQMLAKYNEALKKYDGRWTIKPSLWKCIKEPKD